jgi:hypothetical protein
MNVGEYGLNGVLYIMILGEGNSLCLFQVVVVGATALEVVLVDMAEAHGGTNYP